MKTVEFVEVRSSDRLHASTCYFGKKAALTYTLYLIIGVCYRQCIGTQKGR